MGNDKPECSHDLCPMPAVAKIGDLLICTEHILWAAERNRPGAVVEPVPGVDLPIMERTYPPGVGPGYVD